MSGRDGHKKHKKHEKRKVGSCSPDGLLASFGCEFQERFARSFNKTNFVPSVFFAVKICSQILPRADLGILTMVVLFGQQADGFQRRHTPHAGRRDRLTVDVVRYIAGGEDALDGGFRSSGFDL